MKKLTYNDFNNNILDTTDKYINDKPTVMVFSALGWCVPCKQMHPIVEQLSIEYNNVDIYEIDIEEEEELTSKFGIRNVPTFIFFNKNGEQQKFSGSMSKDKLKTYLEDIIK